VKIDAEYLFIKEVQDRYHRQYTSTSTNSIQNAKYQELNSEEANLTEPDYGDSESSEL